jgi:ribosome-binding protein aMBF1 (putative translation factor)
MDQRKRDRLAALSPEARAKAEAAMARARTPERRAAEAAAREDYDRQMRETGTIASRPLPPEKRAALDPPSAIVPIPGMAELAEKLRAFRESKGLTIDEVAARSGLERGQISKLERGRVRNPTVETLSRFADALDVRLTIDVAPKVGN